MKNRVQKYWHFRPRYVQIESKPDRMRVALTPKRGTKVLVHGMSPAVRRSLTESSVIQHIGKETLTEDFDRALNKELDDIGELYLRRTPKPRDA